jgi:hypothetical protein
VVPGAVERLSYIEGVEITALCDKYPDRVAAAQKRWRKWEEPKQKNIAVTKDIKLCVK